MDLNTRFIVDHPEIYMESRLASAETYRFGTGSATVVMIAAMAAGIRRAATHIEAWARGNSKDAPEYGLPRAHSAR